MLSKQTKKKMIAIVDDESDICELITINLKKSGFNSKAFVDGNSFFRYLQRTIPDLIILDLMLPDYDGMEICKLLKKNPKHASIPIIMLTARDDETDKVLGLELGADDYLTKPFSPKELIARIKVIFRRVSQVVEDRKEGIITVGDMITIDTKKVRVAVNKKFLELTPTEFKILHLMASNQGDVFSRDRILNHLWGDQKAVLDRTIDVHIRRIREKLGEAADVIKNKRGMGYSIEP
ncbi:MAG: response regulator [Elusimicrobia bacterium]|nr:response regulator [Elusimicrobiota bacterium]MBD3411571.1 response regulator [Elusimicrobiota bacterium]